MAHRWLFVTLLAGLAAIAPTTGRADLVRLHNGGEIRGVVDKDGPTGSTGSTVVIETLAGLIIELDREDVEFVTYRRRILEEYEQNARHTPREIEPQRELAAWCRANNLLDERDRHLEMLLELDPDDEEARTTLRHVKHNGEWMSRDEQMEQQGYVKHRNKWVTSQELALIEKSDAEREAEKQWFADVRRMYAGLNHRSPQRQQAALAELGQIRDPAAVPALVKNFGEHTNTAVRMMYVEMLGNVPGPNPVAPLVDRSLNDPDYEIRYRSLNMIGESRGPSSVSMYVKALKSDDNQIVRRAANALARFGGDTVVPHLVEALITRHEYRVAKLSTKGTIGMRSDGSGMQNPGQVSPELAALVRSGAIVQQPSMAVANPHARVKWVRTKYDLQNQEVHGALVKLTGQDFGYDERTWRLWWASKKNGG